MKWTDGEIDKLYQERSENLSFEYNDEYWQELSASLPYSTSVVSDIEWTDGEIDKLYQERSENLSFEYKDDYWQELSESMPDSVSGESDFDIADSEIDKLYQFKAKNLSFDYKSSYWKEMAAMLPKRRKRDAIWYVTSFVFMGLLMVTPFVGQHEVETDNLIARQDSATILQGETTNSNDTNVDANSKGNEENAALTNDANSIPELEKSTPVRNNPIINRAPEINKDLPLADLDTPKDVENIDGGLNSENSDAYNNEINESSAGDVSENSGQAIDPSISITTHEVAATTEDTESSQDAPVNEGALISTNPDARKYDVGELAMKPLDRNEFSNEIVNLNATNPPLNLPTLTTLYVELNGGISQSLISPSEKISYVFGVGIGTQIQKGRFTFTTGINGIMSNHQDLELSRQAKVYGFGSETFSYQLQYKQIYALEANLSVGYRMGIHTVSLGVRPSFAVGSKVTYNSGTTEGEAREVVYGYMNGIKRFGIKPMIGYSVNLSPNLMFGVNVGMKLTPSVNEDFINGVNNTLPIDGQIYLRKSLSFRK